MSTEQTTAAADAVFEIVWTTEVVEHHSVEVSAARLAELAGVSEAEVLAWPREALNELVRASERGMYNSLSEVEDGDSEKSATTRRKDIEIEAVVVPA